MKFTRLWVCIIFACLLLASCCYGDDPGFEFGKGYIRIIIDGAYVPATRGMFRSITAKVDTGQTVAGKQQVFSGAVDTQPGQWHYKSYIVPRVALNGKAPVRVVVSMYSTRNATEDVNLVINTLTSMASTVAGPGASFLLPLTAYGLIAKSLVEQYEGAMNKKAKPFPVEGWLNTSAQENTFDVSLPRRWVMVMANNGVFSAQKDSPTGKWLTYSDISVCGYAPWDVTGENPRTPWKLLIDTTPDGPNADFVPQNVAVIRKEGLSARPIDHVTANIPAEQVGSGTRAPLNVIGPENDPGRFWVYPDGKAPIVLVMAEVYNPFPQGLADIRRAFPAINQCFESLGQATANANANALAGNDRLVFFNGVIAANRDSLGSALKQLQDDCEMSVSDAELVKAEFDKAAAALVAGK